ncbi:MAG: pyridoxal-dependent decarboxylase, partial [Chloroflexota bacterium]
MSFLSDAEIVAQALDAYHRQSVAAEQPAIHLRPLPEIIEQLNLDAFVRDGGLTGPALSAFLEQYFSYATRLHHPAYLAHQVSAPYYAGALGSLIDGFTNNAMAIYEMGPGPTSIEYFMINWLLEKVGWPQQPLDIAQRTGGSGAADFAAGILTHGGSLANLTALLIARNQAAPSAWNDGAPEDLVVLAPQVAHYSMA